MCRRAATIVDVVTTGALATKSTRLGVSLNISVDYLNPIPGGEECKVICRVVKVGKTVATLNAELWRTKTGQLAAQGRHLKFLSPPVGSEWNGGSKQPQSKL